ncbi:hypothetical protein [Longibaculum muris]|uniref:hypothetical protein n=1 Tax=Longibaculum muris TaxID=1796628 RepID=UPI003AB4925F
MNEKLLVNYIKKCYVEKAPLERSLHNKAMLLFKQYILVGGMPKPLIVFIENNKNFSICDREKRDILDLYRSDNLKIKIYKGSYLYLK